MLTKLAANLSMLYHEVSFLDRFSVAARDGFKAIEYLFPYEYRPDEISDELKRNNLTQVLFNLPPGDWNKGERGMACHPGREREFSRSLDLAIEYAHATGCRNLHAMAGLMPQGVPLEVAQETYIFNLRHATRVLAPHGITLLIEPINTRDMPGYFLNFQQQAQDIVYAVGADNLKIQFDLYHCQIMEGDVTVRLKKHFDRIGHIQVAGVPHRNEPDKGELNCRYLFEILKDLGYKGYVGCEYRPKGFTSEGLTWAQSYLSQQ